MGCLGDDPPDPAAGYVAGINTDLETLPARRLIESMARLGESGYVDIPGKGGKTTRQFYDFTGLGESDVNRQVADQLTGELLQIQRELGPQFVEQRLRELELSDPAGAAMRRQLWSAIQESSSTMTDRSSNEELQRMILERIDRAGQLDPSVERELSQQVMGGQVARGNYLGNAAANQEAEYLGAASEAQKAQAQSEAMAFLTGGLAPQDAANRETQQDMANLGAFLSGETPTAQFGQLSGAQAGIVPFNTGAPLPGVNANAGWQGVDYANQLYGVQQQAAANTVNPWVAGLSGALQGVNSWLNLGGGWGSGGGVGAGRAGAAGVQGGWNSGFGASYAGQV